MVLSLVKISVELTEDSQLIKMLNYICYHLFRMYASRSDWSTLVEAILEMVVFAAALKV